MRNCGDCQYRVPNDLHLCKMGRIWKKQAAYLCADFNPCGGKFRKNIKDTNPKDAIGCTKPPLSVIPMGPLYELGLAMLEGACKYGRHNYRVAGVRASIYVDAAMGHIASFWEGEDIDPDSGIHHLMKAAACLFVARDSMLMGNFNDDRPPMYPDTSKMMRRDPRSKEIIGHISDPKPPYTQRGQNESRSD